MRFLIALDQWTGAFQLTVNSEQLTATRQGCLGAETKEAALKLWAQPLSFQNVLTFGASY